MDARPRMLIVGMTVLGATVGLVGGCYFGFAVDKSDLPVAPAFTAPAGAAVGAVAGCVVGAVIA